MCFYLQKCVAHYSGCVVFACDISQTLEWLACAVTMNLEIRICLRVSHIMMRYLRKGQTTQEVEKGKKEERKKGGGGRGRQNEIKQLGHFWHRCLRPGGRQAVVVPGQSKQRMCWEKVTCCSLSFSCMLGCHLGKTAKENRWAFPRLPLSLYPDCWLSIAGMMASLLRVCMRLCGCCLFICSVDKECDLFCLFCFLQHVVFCSCFNEFRNRDKLLQVVMCVGKEFTLHWILSACDLMCYWLHCAFYCLRVDHDMYYPGHPYMYHHGMSKLLCDYLLSCLACWGGVVGPGGWIIVLVYET